MFEYLEISDENVYKLHFPRKEEAVKSFFIKEALGSEDLSIFNTFSVELGDELLLVKQVRDQVSQEEVALIDSLAFLLKKDLENILDYLVYKGEDLDNVKFFKLTLEPHRFHDKLSPYIKSLTSLGLDFETKLVDQNSGETFFAIDCKDYIKFIPYAQYDKEKQTQQIVDSLCEQTSHEPVAEWLQKLYKRHLAKNSFDSNGIHHVLDWMNQLENFSILKESLSYERALAKADRWVEISNQKLGITTSRDKDGVDVDSVYSKGSFVLYHLLSEDAKKREGAKMHNCIGRLHLKNPNLYSLRHNGRRVASICLEDKRAKEIKGPWNKSVESRYHEDVVQALESLNIDLASSNDLHNIGKRAVTFFGTKFVVSQGDALFNITSASEDRIFDGVKEERVKETKENILKHFPESAKEKINEAMDTALAKYVPCPLSGYMVLKVSDYGQYKISKVSKILGDFPEYSNLWKGKVENLVEEKNKGFYSSYIILSAQNLINEYEQISGEKKRVRSFIKSLSSIDSSLDVLPGLYASIFGKTSSVEDLYRRIAEYSKLSDISSLLTDFKEIIKLKDADFECDKVTMESPNDCDHCKNKESYEEQQTQLDDINKWVEEAKEKEKDLNEALGEIHSFAVEVTEFYEKFCKSILRDPSIDIVEGVLHRKKVSEYRDLLSDLDTQIEAMESVLDSSSFNTLEKAVEKMAELDSDLTDIQKEIESCIKSIDKTYSETCPGCSSCYNADEDCEECGGSPNKCDGEEVVNKNGDISISVNYSFDGFRYRGSVNFDSVLEAFKVLRDIKDEPKEFKRHLVSLFSDYSS